MSDTVVEINHYVKGMEGDLRRDREFGVEIEFVNPTEYDREYILGRIAGEVFGTTAYRHDFTNYEGQQTFHYRFIDDKGRVWKIVYDKSIKHGGSTDFESGLELVCPILTADDLEKLSDIFNLLLSMGMFVNETCGIHIHYTAKSYSLNQILSNFNGILERQEYILKTFGVPEYRSFKYCKIFDDITREYFKTAMFLSVEDMLASYHRLLGEGVDPNHPKNPSRYYIVNMNSIVRHGTIEFRFFNSTLSIATFIGYLLFLDSIWV